MYADRYPQLGPTGFGHELSGSIRAGDGREQRGLAGGFGTGADQPENRLDTVLRPIRQMAVNDGALFADTFGIAADDQVYADTAHASSPKPLKICSMIDVPLFFNGAE
jgi:hypothetical protein